MNIIKAGYKSFAAILLSSTLGVTAFSQTVFINDGKVVTNAQLGTLETADVLIVDGRISDIDTELTAPDGVQVIEAEGQWVTPGLFSAYSQVGLVEVSLEASTNDSRASEASTSVSDLGADGFNPKSPVIGNTRMGGITHAAITPRASHNIFGGRGFVANMSGDFDSIKDEVAFVFVEMGSRGADLAGGSRSASMSQLRAALDDALAFPARFDGPEEGDALSRRDAAALAPAARGQVPLMIAADRAIDILKIIDLKNDYGRLDVIILGGAEAWMVTKQLEENFVRVILDPHANLPGNFNGVGSRLDNAVLLEEAGVEYAFMTNTADTSHFIYVLRQHAGNAVGNGLDWDSAFKAISSVPASWFNQRIGQLVQGGEATVIVWDGDPLEVTSTPVYIMIEGEVQSLDSRQRALRDRYNPTSTETKPHKYR